MTEMRVALPQPEVVDELYLGVQDPDIRQADVGNEAVGTTHYGNQDARLLVMVREARAIPVVIPRYFPRSPNSIFRAKSYIPLSLQ